MFGGHCANVTCKSIWIYNLIIESHLLLQLKNSCMCNPHFYFGPRRFSELECLCAVRLISQYSNVSEITNTPCVIRRFLHYTRWSGIVSNNIAFFAISIVVISFYIIFTIPNPTQTAYPMPASATSAWTFSLHSGSVGIPCSLCKK